MSIRTYAELVPPPEFEQEVVLHMSEAEAKTLHLLLFTRVTGWSPGRKRLDDIQSALANAGVELDQETHFDSYANISQEKSK